MYSDPNKLAEENLRLAKENNKLLKKLRRAQTIGAIFKLVWVGIIIGVPVALYVYVLQPYYTEIRTRFDAFQEQAQNVPGLNVLFGKSQP